MNGPQNVINGPQNVMNEPQKVINGSQCHEWTSKWILMKQC